MRGGVVIAVAAVLLLAACGGSSRLSASAYRGQIAKIKQQAVSAQAGVALGLQAKTVLALRQRLNAFAAAIQRIGEEVSKLKPPKNAEAVNAELAQGARDTAVATRAASGKIAKLKTAHAAIAYLEHSGANDKGAHELNDSLAKLRKLGYTTGG